MSRIVTGCLALAIAAASCSDADRAAAPEPVDRHPADRPGRIVTALDAGAGEAADPRDRYLFYLHGAIIERAGRRPTHPEFGVYEYDAILKRFADAGRVVISEQRAPDTDIREYAGRVARAVGRLIESGVPERQITVVGFSKGGGIALWVSDQVPSPEVGHVILAACGNPYPPGTGPDLHGRVLSIYEASDELGRSCRTLLDDSAAASGFREVEISVGGGHGAFYTPRPEWVDEILGWPPAPGSAQ